MTVFRGITLYICSLDGRCPRPLPQFDGADTRQYLLIAHFFPPPPLSKPKEESPSWEDSSSLFFSLLTSR